MSREKTPEKILVSGSKQKIIMRKQNLSEYFVLIFYTAATLAAVLYAWNELNIIKRGGNSPIYVNLRECPAYVRMGFDPADLRIIPDEGTQSGGVWKRFKNLSRRIKDSGLDIPKRRYLSPWGKNAQEYTITFLPEMDSAAMAFLNGNTSVIPGIFFAGIGESWEVYFNGKLVISQMHLDETGRIKERRTWRDAYFPLDSSLVCPGINILTVRIMGDPTYRGTGLFYSTAPVYLNDYKLIERRRSDYLHIFICGFFAFTGVFYLMIFFSVKNKKEIFYLYFGIFSILLCIYNFSVQGLINSLIPNSDISVRMEYGSLTLSIPVFGMFLEAFGRGKNTKISVAYLAFSFFLCLTQTFFCVQYGEEAVSLWNIVTMIYVSYILIYEVIYINLWKRYKEKAEGRETQDFSIGSILVGIVICYLCGIADFLDIFFKSDSIYIFPYSVFMLHIGMTFILSQRFSGMYKRLEKSNIMLELAVQERTMEMERQTGIAVQANMAKSRFLATMSHEIRTPLNAVIGLSEIELRNFRSGSKTCKLPDSSRENILQINQSGESLLGIINDILDISKIEAGSFELVPAEYETAPFISGTVNLNMVRCVSKPVNFILKINGDFPAKLIGDELRVKQVLNNLLSNAIKYTDEGTVTLDIAWSACGDGKVRLIFTVRDTGIGIRSEDIKKLFTSYAQLDTGANRKIEGTGLGLAITKNLVEMMGGSISVESEYGKGSVFTAQIIQGVENAGIDDTTVIGEETARALQEFRYAPENSEEIITPSFMPNAQVLVVDDLPVNLLVARGLLVPYGLKADIAASGREAVELVKNHNYDLIFMDHMMPEMDGVETLTAIRKIEGYAHTPIIALTANALLGMREFYLENGFQDYISKPIYREALDEIINKWLNDKITMNNEQVTKNRKMEMSDTVYLEIMEQRIDILNHYLVSFTNVPEADWRTKFDKAYFERFTALLKSLVTDEMPSALREQADLLAEAGMKEDARKIRDALPVFCEVLQKWREQEQKAAGDEHYIESKIKDEILPRLKKALLAGETETAEAVIGELGETALTPAGRELYFKLYALMLEGNTEKIMEAVKETRHD